MADNGKGPQVAQRSKGNKVNYEWANTDALIDAADFLFGEEATDKLCELADLIDDAEKRAQAKGFEEGLREGERFGYNKGYVDGIDGNQPCIFADAADEFDAEVTRSAFDDCDIDEQEAIERAYDALETLFDAERE